MQHNGGTDLYNWLVAVIEEGAEFWRKEMYTLYITEHTGDGCGIRINSNANKKCSSKSQIILGKLCIGKILQEEMWKGKNTLNNKEYL